MRKYNYEKPEMKGFLVENREKVAAGNCWSEAASTGKTTWYYDYNTKEERGYVVFEIETNCGGDLFNIDARPDSLDDTAEALAAISELENNSTGNGWVKQEFTDSGVIFDDITKVS